MEVMKKKAIATSPLSSTMGASILPLALAFVLSAGTALAQPKPAVKSAKPAASAESKPADKPSDDKKKAEEKASTDKKESKPAVELPIENVVGVQAEDLVRAPSDYLGKNIRFTAPFFSFSNVALDYKPALRQSKTHFSFLVLRPNSHVPLSELKLAMPIPKDEKDPMSKVIAGFKEKDELEITGKVFAVALDEPWVDVLRIKKIKSAPDDKAEKEKTEKEKSESK